VVQRVVRIELEKGGEAGKAGEAEKVGEAEDRKEVEEMEVPWLPRVQERTF